MAHAGQYGGFWARLIALVLDNAVVFLVALGAALALLAAASAVGMQEAAAVAVSLICVLLPLLYWPALESSRWRATVGKRVMGLEVTDLDGNRLDFLRAFLRVLAKLISAIPLGIGFLIAAFTARKQALHDMVVKTLVVQAGPSQLWKLILALVLGLVLMVAGAAGLVYLVVIPMFKQGMEDVRKEMTKDAPRAKAQPQAVPGKTPSKPAPAAPAPRPAAPAAPAATSAKSGPDPEFDAVMGKPLAGPDKPGTVRAGPAVLELSSWFQDKVWLKVHLPLPAQGAPELVPAAVVTVERALDTSGADFYNAESSFEKDFFRRAALRQDKDPEPRLTGIRTVQLKPGITEQALQRIDGQITLRAPVSPTSVGFDAKEPGKEKAAHDSAITLVSVQDGTARLRFRGASENLLAVRGLGADGKPVATESRQLLPERRDVDQEFVVKFKEAPAKIEVSVAQKVIERYFPFALTRAGSAGPASGAASAGFTVPARARTAIEAAPTPVAAPKPVPVATVPVAPKPIVEPAKPAAVAAPKPEPKSKPAPVAAKPAAAPKPAPVARPAEPAPVANPAPAPAPARDRRDETCVYKPVMTDEEIDRCR